MATALEGAAPAETEPAAAPPALRWRLRHLRAPAGSLDYQPVEACSCGPLPQVGPVAERLFRESIAVPGEAAPEVAFWLGGTSSLLVEAVYRASWVTEPGAEQALRELRALLEWCEAHTDPGDRLELVPVDVEQAKSAEPADAGGPASGDNPAASQAGPEVPR